MSSLVSHTLGFSPAQWKAIEMKARRSGLTASEYLASLVERDVLAGQTFDEILRPIRKDFRASGISADQLESRVHKARHALKRRNHG